MDPYIEPIFDMFYNLLGRIGHHVERLPITKVEKYDEQVDISVDQYKCHFLQQYNFYSNKASYMFSDYVAVTQKIHKQSAVVASLNNLVYNIKFNQSPNIPIVEYRWWIEGDVKEMPKSARVEMLHKAIRCMKQWLDPNLVEIGNRVKVPGLIVAAYPKGLKNPDNPVASMVEIGRRQREALAVRCGFSKPKSDGFVYGIFNDKLEFEALE